MAFIEFTTKRSVLTCNKIYRQINYEHLHSTNRKTVELSKTLKSTQKNQQQTNLHILDLSKIKNLFTNKSRSNLKK